MYSKAYMRQWAESSFIQVMTSCLLTATSYPETMLTCRQLDPYENISMKFIRNSDFLTKEKAFQMVVCKTAASCTWSRCVKQLAGSMGSQHDNSLGKVCFLYKSMGLIV